MNTFNTNDINASNLSATTISATTYYNLPQIPAISITYADLSTALSTSALTPDAVYFISDKNIWVKAISNTLLSPSASRQQTIVKDDGYKLIGTKGIWYIENTYSIGDKVIWGGQLWLNLNGNAGSSFGYPNWLDDTEWSLITSDALYYDKIFDIEYDFINNKIRIQRDDRYNTIYYNEAMDFPGMDLTDWGDEAIRTNICDGIYNNHILYDDGAKIEGNLMIGAPSSITCAIYGNRNYGINNNKILGNIYDNINTGTINSNTNKGSIFFNNNLGSIYRNENNGDISNSSSNVTDVFNNSNTGPINNNSNTGSIQSNSNAGTIQDNSNLGSIYNNENNGQIYLNSNSASISYNTNLGSISNNTSNVTTIELNSNLGEITSNSNTSNISNNSNTATISNNSNTGSIYLNNNNGRLNNNANVGDIMSNSNTGDIINNSGNGAIKTNSNNGNISQNEIDTALVVIDEESLNITGIMFNIGNGNIDSNILSAEDPYSPCGIRYNSNGTYLDPIDGSGIVSNTLIPLSGSGINTSIVGNSNNGGIGYNGAAGMSGNISNNSNNGKINANNINGDITNNNTNGSIEANSNNGSIMNNSNAGEIIYNTNNGNIDTNANNGYINNNTQVSGTCNISNNDNNGGISGARTADVIGTIVNI